MRKQVLIVPFLFSLLFLAIFVGCGKKSSPAPDPGASPITLSSWKYDTSGVDFDKNGTIDFADTLLKACQKDNTYLFKNDSSGVSDESTTRCKVSDPQTVPFNWGLRNNGTILLLAGNTVLSGSLNISSVTSTKFNLYKDTTVSGIPIRYLIMLKH
ncbi:MAG TPA: hypothetical protein VK563_16070 [Puia sp.]|nr:hypothetical protein [Puia sp.]